METILPSIQSVMTAVLHYKKMGGEANLYINDDGLQVQLIFQFSGTDVLDSSPPMGRNYFLTPLSCHMNGVFMFHRADLSNWSVCFLVLNGGSP